MKKNTVFLAILCVILSLSASLALSDETTDIKTSERRVEEQKRLSLQSTEALIVEQKIPSAIPPKQAINRKFYNRLITQPIARKLDGIYSVMVLLGKQKDFTSFDAELVFLKDQGYLLQAPKKPWKLEEPLLKGELAYMLCKALRIKGGLHMRLFGSSARYALFELVYMKIMVYGDPREKVSGRELAYSFMQAADYLMAHNHDDISK